MEPSDYIEGEARNIQQRQESQEQIAWTFRVERYDQSGNRLQPVPVEMRGRSFRGFVSEGDWVRVPVPRGWRSGQLVRTNQVWNLTADTPFGLSIRLPKKLIFATILLGAGIAAAVGLYLAIGSSDSSPPIIILGSPTPQDTALPSTEVTPTIVLTFTPEPTAIPLPEASAQVGCDLFPDPAPEFPDFAAHYQCELSVLHSGDQTTADLLAGRVDIVMSGAENGEQDGPGAFECDVNGENSCSVTIIGDLVPLDGTLFPSRNACLERLSPGGQCTVDMIRVVDSVSTTSTVIDVSVRFTFEIEDGDSAIVSEASTQILCSVCPGAP